MFLLSFAFRLLDGLDFDFYRQDLNLHGIVCFSFV